VISVGNLTAGGSGKTPFVEHLVRMLLERGRAVAVVSRGYGRASRGVVVVSDGHRILVDAKAGGDEPLQMARKFPALRVVVGERRIDGARKAAGDLGADVIVLDDAYQHRYLHRDLNILVLEASRNILREPMLPAGMRREPLSGVSRADCVAWSGVSPRSSLASLSEKTASWYRGPAVAYRTITEAVCRAGDDSPVPHQRHGSRLLAFSGIGNHRRFIEGLRGDGWSVGAEIVFPDHHWYVGADLQRILREFRDAHADFLMTTEKDAVRLSADSDIRRNFLLAYPVLYTRIVVEVIEGEQTLGSLVDACLAGGGIMTQKLLQIKTEFQSRHITTEGSS
jgi:tetraacyldisaccharide 4'-kinase